MREKDVNTAERTSTFIPCVRCGKKMNRKNFGRISGVIIDECGKHGVWLIQFIF